MAHCDKKLNIHVTGQKEIGVSVRIIGLWGINILKYGGYLNYV